MTIKRNPSLQRSAPFEETKNMATLLRAIGGTGGKHPRIRLKTGLWSKEPLILVDGGAITTQERFEGWYDSLAHLSQDGIIRCFGEPIGTADDIEYLKEEK